VRRFAADNGIKAYSNAPSLELFLNGVSQGSLANGTYVTPPEPDRAKDGTEKTHPGMPVENVFFWKAPLAPGRNVIKVVAPSGAQDEMVIYQGDADGNVPADPGALVQNLKSSNPKTAAVYLDRPVAAQEPVYLDVDGSSDNTFDRLPSEITGATTITTRRLSDPVLKTDLSFKLNPASHGANVYVLLSTGTYPTITLKPRDSALAAAAIELEAALAKAGFTRSPQSVVWRDHLLVRADAALWMRPVSAGESVAIPGVTLDYTVLLKPIAH
jgi:hypothetical protein